MSMPSPELDADARAHVVAVAAALNDRLVDVTLDMRAVLATRIGELDGDDRLLDLLGASIEGNVDNILHSLRHGIPVDRIEPPSAAFEYARRLAQRDVPVNALVRAYRLGQQNLVQAAYAESLRHACDESTRARAYDHIVNVTFDYIDWISQRVVVVYESERERWLADRNTMRVARVEELVASDDLDDIDAAEAAIGYRLRVRHLGAVVWVDETGAPRDQIHRFTAVLNAIAERLGAPAPLVIPRDRASAWFWIAVGADYRFDPEPIAGVLKADLPPQAMMAFGRPASGPDGFRRSHLEAIDAQRVCVVGDRHRAVTCYGEPGLDVVALLSTQPEATRRWVQTTLGSLATDDENHERLRETLRLFLRHDGSYTATAGAMLMHKNSVRYRISSAEKAIGSPIADNRQSVELALAACHWLGARVLTTAPVRPGTPR